LILRNEIYIRIFIKNINRKSFFFFTLFNIRVIGAPGADIEARRSTCDDDNGTCFRVACSADDGVETESDEEELEDDDIIGICDVTPPFAVVFMGITGMSDKLSSFFCLLGDDIMTFEGNILLFCFCNSFD
jgi:hypothetical protein